MTGTVRIYVALLALAWAMAGSAWGQAGKAPPMPASDRGAPEYLLAPGDVIRISVFQSPDLNLETRIDEKGAISFPLIGTVPVSGASVGAAEQRIAKMLREGGFMVAPHVTIVVVQVRGNQVTVLGQVGKPGRYPLESSDSRLTDVIALAGGIAAGGGDIVILSGVRDGRQIRREIDLQNLANADDPVNNPRLQAGDMLLVNRAPSFYIYGEVQKPGAYRLERSMTVMQALATSGGLTAKGTQRGLTIHRRGSDGTVQVVEPKLDDSILVDDVLYVKESLF
jgi:polysaccharide export outer membrane protein